MENQLTEAQLKVLKERRDSAIEETMLDRYKRRLTQIISKKITTSFIGAVAYIEKYFGFLWGMELFEHERTEDQQRMYDLWQALRAEILTNGNTQLRAAQNEIAQYKVVWNRYHTEFKVKEEDK